MTFTQQEKDLILYGQQNGKSQREVEDAILRLRTNNPIKQVAPTAAPDQSDNPDFLHPLDALSNQYKGSINTAKDAVVAGTETIKKGGVKNVIHGAAQSGVGAAAAGVEAIFAPFAASANAIVPGDGIASDTAKGAIVGAELGSIVPGAGTLVGAGVGALFGGGLHVVNKIKDAIFAHSNISEADKALINNALNVGLAILGEKVGSAKTEGKGLNTPVSEVTAGLKNKVNTVRKNVTSIPEKVVSTIKKAQQESQSILTSTQDLITPIDANVKNVLENSPQDRVALDQKITRLVDTARKANHATGETGKITPYEIVGKENLGASLKRLNEILTESGTNKDAALKVNGAKTFDPAQINQLQADFATNLAERVGVEIKGKKVLPMEGRETNMTAADQRIVTDINAWLKQAALGKKTAFQANDFIDNLQRQLYDSHQIGAQALNGKVEGLIKETIGTLNEHTKTIVGDEYREANDVYSEARVIRDELNKRLGKDSKNAGAIMKRIFSPQDGGTKDLMQQIQDLTGIPIFDDATLAKFAMDIVGDPRAKSLLETKDLSVSGMIDKFLKLVDEKMTDPEGKARRILENRVTPK